MTECVEGVEKFHKIERRVAKLREFEQRTAKRPIRHRFRAFATQVVNPWTSKLSRHSKLFINFKSV